MKNNYIKKQILLLTLFLTFIITFQPSKAQIVGEAGFTNIVTAGSDHNCTAINPSFNIGANSYIYNRFTQFDLPVGESANLLLNGSGTSINIITSAGGADIQGSVNSRVAGAGSAIGGNIIFISPNGISLNPGGSINCGSILLSTSNQTLVPLGPPGGTADLNNPASLISIVSQGIDPTGSLTLQNPTGDITTTPGTAITATPVNPVVANRNGVFMFAEDISIGGNIQITNSFQELALVSAQSLSVNLSTGNDSTTPLAATGSLSVPGTGSIVAPSANVELELNTNLVPNVINIIGTIQADAILADTDGGNIELVHVQQGGNTFVTGGGALNSRGTGTGNGGIIDVTTDLFRVDAASNVAAYNGLSSNVGGTFILRAAPGTGPVVIGNAGTDFIDAVSFTRMTLYNTVAAEGNFYLYDSSLAPGITINNTIAFPGYTHVYLYSNGGNLNMPNVGVSHDVGRDFNVYANNITIDNGIVTNNSDILLRSATGQIDIQGNGILESSATGNVILTRYGGNGNLTVTNNGNINSGTFAGLNPLIIGNYGAYTYTDDVTLNGAGFGTLAGNITTPGTLSAAAAPGVNASQIDVSLNGPPPPPPPTPPAPNPPPAAPDNNTSDDITLPEKTEVVFETESITNDILENDTNVLQYDASDTDTTDSSDNTSNTSSNITATKNAQDGTLNSGEVVEVLRIMTEKDTNVGELEKLEKLFDTCTATRDACLMNVNNGLGEYVIEILIKGYPYDNEFAADAGGLRSAYSVKYHPKGIESFLKKIKYLEDKLAEQKLQGQVIKDSNLMGYKHPPAAERIEKVDIIMTDEHMKTINTRVNKKRYIRNVDKEINQ